jgi:hypothetical protein
MSDDYLSDNIFKTSVLGLFAAGVSLYGYKNYLAKRSFMVEYKAYVDDIEESTVDPDKITQGTHVFDERPIFSKSHKDIVQNVYDNCIKNDQKFQNIPPERVRILIQRIHIM